MTTIAIEALVNGETAELDVPPTERLSVTLRRRLGLTGTKVGCDAGDCGACSVLLESDVVCACMVPASRIDGLDVTTVEALAGDPLGQRLQQAFLDHGAAQCGICTPGMLMSAVAAFCDQEMTCPRAGDRRGPGRRALPLHRLSERSSRP